MKAYSINLTDNLWQDTEKNINAQERREKRSQIKTGNDIRFFCFPCDRGLSGGRGSPPDKPMNLQRFSGKMPFQWTFSLAQVIQPAYSCHFFAKGAL